MSRSQIDRLTGRIEALQAQRKPPEQRIFTVLVRNHMRADEEIARFCAEHGVTDSDLLIAQVVVRSRRARAKPQKMPTNASCAPGNTFSANTTSSSAPSRSSGLNPNYHGTLIFSFRLAPMTSIPCLPRT